MLTEDHRVPKRILSVLLALTLVLALTAMAKDRILRYLDGGLLNTVDDCAGSAALEREIDALPFFAAAPPGTGPVKGFEPPGGRAGCLDDSGDELITAGTVYRLTGDKQAVADHFRAVAERDGWKRGPAESVKGDSLESTDPADLCFGKRLENGPVVVYVLFRPAAQQIEVDAYSLLDGTATVC
ncbi:hypothetical protein [Streptomyces qinzhouensis]|uniref:Uncharacterized protein n=1 Tax=Streptomyces qinzhouensis TaxID=2599401 RepID=A0A5B8J640_9ACTN|nr:hypothetical protein [Streptomyces qinzhouensis]QDY77275.1 hypothetical protein FQU76_12970 [Streptomyces qinzhouensis]